MVEGLETQEKSLPLQTAYRVGLVAIVGAALYTVGELAATFPIVGAVIWMTFGLFLPTACVIGVLHSRGDQQVFFIGALFPAALTLSVAVTLFVIMTFDPDDIGRLDFSQICLPIAWFLTLGCGALATLIARRLAGANTKLAAAGFSTNDSTESSRFFWQ